MAKAILILDEMPKCCADCILGDDDPSGLYCVPKDEYFDGEDTTESRSTWCPLREVPQKIGIDEALKMPRDGCIADVIRSYNACIDEILGGGE